MADGSAQLLAGSALITSGGRVRSVVSQGDDSVVLPSEATVEVGRVTGVTTFFASDPVVVSLMLHTTVGASGEGIIFLLVRDPGGQNVQVETFGNFVDGTVAGDELGVALLGVDYPGDVSGMDYAVFARQAAP